MLSICMLSNMKVFIEETLLLLMPSTETYQFGVTMAKNTGNARSPIRWIRDSVKQQYPKGTSCEICGTEHDLEYHHYHTLSLMFDKYCKEEKIVVNTDDEVLAIREDFSSKYWSEVVTDGVTLCNMHHKQLHKIYGKQPELSTASKQKGWVVRMNAKQTGETLEVATSTDATSFASFLPSVEPSFQQFIP